jgi:hypothetical protein
MPISRKGVEAEVEEARPRSLVGVREQISQEGEGVSIRASCCQVSEEAWWSHREESQQFDASERKRVSIIQERNNADRRVRVH